MTDPGDSSFQVRELLAGLPIPGNDGRALITLHLGSGYLVEYDHASIYRLYRCANGRWVYVARIRAWDYLVACVVLAAQISEDELLSATATACLVRGFAWDPSPA